MKKQKFTSNENKKIDELLIKLGQKLKEEPFDTNLNLKIFSMVKTKMEFNAHQQNSRFFFRDFNVLKTRLEFLIQTSLAIFYFTSVLFYFFLFSSLKNYFKNDGGEIFPQTDRFVKEQKLIDIKTQEEKEIKSKTQYETMFLRDTIDLTKTNPPLSDLGFIPSNKNIESLIQKTLGEKSIKYKKIKNKYVTDWIVGKYNNQPVKARFLLTVKNDTTKKILVSIEIKKIPKVDINQVYHELLNKIK
ncbi:MAG: hypothetical protein QW051_02235 [Candidatus Aenigmatarchaeota archaeon]